MGLMGVTCETVSPDIHGGEASNGRLVLKRLEGERSMLTVLVIGMLIWETCQGALSRIGNYQAASHALVTAGVFGFIGSRHVERNGSTDGEDISHGRSEHSWAETRPAKQP